MNNLESHSENFDSSVLMPQAQPRMNHKEGYTEEYIASVLKDTKSIAMVGASPNPTKFSYGVLRVLHEQGFKMYPVNPKPEVEEIRGIRVYSSLAEIDGPVDMVEVFRRSDALYGVTQEAIDIGAKILWSQIGVYDEKAARLAEDAGMRVVMDRCVKIELFRPFWKPRLNQEI